MRLLTWLLVIAVTLYAAVVAYLYVEQREIMYRPEQTERVPPSHYPMLTGVDEVELHTADGYRVFAWYAPAPAGQPTVVIFHGNGGSLRSQRYRLVNFKDANMGVLLLAYRGYSGSDGEPTEEGLYTDARAALDWLKERGVTDDRIVLYGESLGTGVATKMAVEHKVAAVVLESPYTSTADVAKEHFAFVPVDLLMLDRFDSLARIGDVHEPLLIMHGEKDEVIPQAYGLRLFGAANEPKEGYWPKLAGHNTIFDLGGSQTAVDFIERNVKPQ
jgi:fermentation-respiration switch protein FrsA (DUF1100 family)